MPEFHDQARDAGRDPCRRRGTARLPSRLAALFGAGLLACVATAPATSVRDPASEVNTFIGTQGEGNTFPGASAPFGLIQVSPITEHYAGYRYDDPKIRGFGHSFVSGAGCWEQGGQVAVLPVAGSIGPGGDFDTSDPKAASFDYRHYAAPYTHAGEVGSAGYYRVQLLDAGGRADGGIDVEATARTRAAAERYTFAADARTGHVLVNVGQANEKHEVVGSVVEVVGDRVVEGKLVTKSFCGGTQYTTWFRLEFDRPFKAFGTWDKDGAVPGSRRSVGGQWEAANGAWLDFDLADGRTVTASSAISHVDADGARRNLDADGRSDGRLLPFDEMRALAQSAWRKELMSVRIEGARTADRRVFYTALYHALLQPMTGSDADGRYRGYDDAIHVAEGWTYYEYFSLWDTYRSQNQLLAMLRPSRARDIARSMLAIHAQMGWLPRWGYANFETNVMTGDPVTPWLVDLWRFGALQGREREAWDALWQNANGRPPAMSRAEGRAGNDTYLAQGFVPYDRASTSKGMDADPRHGGSATLEYALADCALSQMATGLGETAAAASLRARAGNWQRVWDPAVRDPELDFRGFPRPRIEGGAFFQPTHGEYSPRSDKGFHEGTAWQYQWLVQDDVPGLVAAMGGLDAARARLDAFFAYDALVGDLQGGARANWVVGPYSYYNQYRYNPNNEPDLHAPWMYVLLGQPWKTDVVVRAAQALFRDAPDGVTGNDDLGTMSAWYLFSALGMYPAVPGTGQLLLHAPRYPRVEIDLEGGGTLVLEAPGVDPGKAQSIAGVAVDGDAHPQSWIDWSVLREGGNIAYTLTDAPSGDALPVDGWGTHPADLPMSPCASPTASVAGNSP